MMRASCLPRGAPLRSMARAWPAALWAALCLGMGCKAPIGVESLDGGPGLNPPTVEGWHTGTEWISISSLSKRVNFAAKLVGDVTRPGIKSIISRLSDMGKLQPEQMVDACLDLMGPVEAASENRQQLIDFACEHGEFNWDTKDSSDAATDTVIELLRLILLLRK